MTISSFQKSRRLWLGAAVVLFSLRIPSAEGAAPSLLEPDRAFQVHLRQKDKRTIVAEFMVAKHYHLYKDKIHFSTKNPSGISIRAVRFPTGIVKSDPNFGRVELLKDKVEVEIVLERPTINSRLALLVSYQGCEEEAGVCYPPVQKELFLTLK